MGRKKKVKAPINPRNFEGQDDEYVLAQVLDDIDRSQKFIASRIEDFKEYYRLYNSKLSEDEKRREGANLFIPYTYSQIETCIPKMLGSVIEARPYISYKAVGKDDNEKAEKMTALVGYQLEKNMKFVTELYDVYKSVLMYGTAITKQSWKYETKKSIKRQYKDTSVVTSDGAETMTKKLTPVEVERVIYDAPVVKNIPIEDFFFDPAKTEIADCSFCGIQYTLERHELLDGEEKGIYKNTGNIADVDDYQNTTVIPDDKAKTSAKNSVLIHEYWTDDWKVMVANKAVVVQCIPNPYYHKRKPFTKWVAIHMPNEFYGKSMVETLSDLQAELNTIRSQRIDNVTMALNRMWLINKNADIDTEQLISRPNGFVEVDNIQDDIKELVMQDVTQSAYQDEEIIKSDMDTTSGVHAYDRGSNPDKQDTATVANLLSSASSERFRLMVMMLSNDPITDMGDQLAELNKQFLTEETFIKITDSDEGTEEEVTITFDDIDAEFDVIPVSTALEPSVNKEVRQSQLIQLLNIAANMPEVNSLELIKEIFKAFEFKNVEELVQPVEPEVPEEMAEEGAAQEEVPEEGQAQEEPSGLYPQLGGVGSMANYLQNPVA